MPQSREVRLKRARTAGRSRREGTDLSVMGHRLGHNRTYLQFPFGGGHGRRSVQSCRVGCVLYLQQIQREVRQRWPSPVCKVVGGRINEIPGTRGSARLTPGRPSRSVPSIRIDLAIPMRVVANSSTRALGYTTTSDDPLCLVHRIQW